MGDRTSVTLMVLEEQANEAKAFFIYDPDEETLDEPFQYFHFSEISHGNLGFLDDLLNAGIAFDSSWCSISEYGPGTDYLRFLPDGSVWSEEIYDSAINPSLEKCMELIDKPEELRQYLVDHHKEVTPPSWENQIEYGKRYRAKMLISS